MSRPEILFPLFADIEALGGIGAKTARAFAALQVVRPRDVLFLLPQGGIERRACSSLRDIRAPIHAVIDVMVTAHIPPRSKSGAYRVMVKDQFLEWPLVFFRARGNYLETLLPVGQRRIVSGKVDVFDGIPQIVHPDYVGAPGAEHELPAFSPVYPLSAGLTQKILSKAVAASLARTPDLPEWIDPALLEREGWPSWKDALIGAHAPQSPADLAPQTPARARLAYDEVFAHQLTLALARASQRRKKGVASLGDDELRRKVLGDLPFAPTNAQQRAIDEIIADMAAPQRMNRLLQGDVGSGKTLVAFMALLAAVEAGGQGAFMGPTEILARQHHEALAPMAAAVGVRLLLLTGRDRGAERAAKLADLAEGRANILVGTHALFQKDVVFQDIRLAVIDEQHRFGVAQRMGLGNKGRAVDVLVMTATPIPRSLALVSYGDMDLSVLDEKPAGRKPIRTAMLSTARLDEVHAHLARALSEEGRQAYWVCPLVEESDLVDYSSVEERYASLCKALGPEMVGLVHGRMLPAEKDAAMARFVAGDTRVLVATTVIEVGVNVPNATIMVIERAESFGLAQLHQLRGRVGRGEAESTCLLLYQAPLSDAAGRRLKTIRDTEDGFRIAEEDLAIRGAGDVIGTAQSGLPRFRIADPERQAGLIALAQSDARALLTHDPQLTSPRGQAARLLLWLLDQDVAIRLINVG